MRFFQTDQLWGQIIDEVTVVGRHDDIEVEAHIVGCVLGLREGILVVDGGITITRRPAIGSGL